MTTPVYKSHPDEIDALMGKTAYGNADTSRADIVTRIREYRDCYGNREFAELLAQACLTFGVGGVQFLDLALTGDHLCPGSAVRSQCGPIDLADNSQSFQLFRNAFPFALGIRRQVGRTCSFSIFT
jgi:hypothetical protein